MEAIYLDNAATSFPKPAGVSDRMKYYLDCVGANVNRSVYTAAQEAGLVTLTLRQRLARLFGFPEPPTHVILTPGATAGLNMIISGLLRPGDHCIVSSMEHNAVMRPLLRLPPRRLRKRRPKPSRPLRLPETWLRRRCRDVSSACW